jgi:alpha-D-xyloside xylohydrolase
VTERFHPVLRQGLYGLGQHQSGQFNYQGDVVRLAQANTDIAHPLMVSTQGYGLLWNTAAASTMDNRFPTEMTFQADAGQAIDYLFIHGPEFDDIVGAYRRLTGRRRCSRAGPTACSSRWTTMTAPRTCWT